MSIEPKGMQKLILIGVIFIFCHFIISGYIYLNEDIDGDKYRYLTVTLSVFGGLGWFLLIVGFGLIFKLLCELKKCFYKMNSIYFSFIMGGCLISSKYYLFAIIYFSEEIDPDTAKIFAGLAYLISAIGFIILTFGIVIGIKQIIKKYSDYESFTQLQPIILILVGGISLFISEIICLITVYKTLLENFLIWFGTIQLLYAIGFLLFILGIGLGFKKIQYLSDEYKIPKIGKLPIDVFSFYILTISGIIISIGYIIVSINYFNLHYNPFETFDNYNSFKNWIKISYYLLAFGFLLFGIGLNLGFKGLIYLKILELNRKKYIGKKSFKKKRSHGKTSNKEKSRKSKHRTKGRIHPTLTLCPNCNKKMEYIFKFNDFYCWDCDFYLNEIRRKFSIQLCPICNIQMVYVKEYDDNYCMQCDKYLNEINEY